MTPGKAHYPDVVETLAMRYVLGSCHEEPAMI